MFAYLFLNNRILRACLLMTSSFGGEGGGVLEKMILGDMGEGVKKC